MFLFNFIYDHEILTISQILTLCSLNEREGFFLFLVGIKNNYIRIFTLKISVISCPTDIEISGYCEIKGKTIYIDKMKIFCSNFF